MTMRLGVLVLLFGCFSVSSALHFSDEEDVSPSRAFCRDLSCAPRKELLKAIDSLRSEVAVQKTLNADSECTICFSNPCQNGGTCNPLSTTAYSCECPDDYTGANCETHVVCDGRCGQNTDCYVQNHQVNCVCKPGMSGDPLHGGCSLQTRTSCFNGDPHYRTFDGTSFDYMGTCPYMFSMPCTQLNDGYSWFSVKAKNEENSPGAGVSAVVSTQVSFYNKTVYVDRDLHIYVDGILTHVPYYYPSKDFPQFTISSRGALIVIENDQYVKVEFQYGQLCLTIPDVPAFRQTGALCGLSGDSDYNCHNDFKLQDGSLIDQDCVHKDVHQSDLFADSWINLDYQHQEGLDACVDGKQMTNSSHDCTISNAVADCQAIFGAFNRTGPFGACQDLGGDAIQKAYDDCLFDVCRMPDLKCPVLTSFAHQCQSALPGVNIDGWRDSDYVQCPIHCPANSDYSPCASSCPASCSDQEAPEFCTLPCTEGCACKPGYVLDNTVLDRTTCIKISDCGCTDNDGNFHPPEQPWLTNNCEQWNDCIDGKYHWKQHVCSPYGHCAIYQFQESCLCDTGFTGDGENCTDINECDDLSSCSVDKGQGTCINTLGSYTCECNQFYDGHDCEVYAPKRHCADLYVYHNIRENGVYEVFPPFIYESNSPSLQVYCQMTIDNGGWTLVTNTLSNGTANRTLEDYTLGFGNPEERDVWLGLDLLYGYTNYQESSLRLNLYRCAHNGLQSKTTYCTYPYFSLLDPSTGYQVNITDVCSGTELEFYDGWARWDLSHAGPPFIAFDNDHSQAGCSATFQNTGFWFDTSYRCGEANLNGIRYACDAPPPENERQTYLWWGGAPLSTAELLLRPVGYPNYDNGAPLNTPEFIADQLKKPFIPNVHWND